MVKKFKITTILGTRPELIRLSSVISSFDKVFDHRLIHTGQNSDPNLSDIFFEELDIRKPNKFINIESDSLGVFLGKLFIEIDTELYDNKPDALVILGDTNSALSAILAKRKGIPVYHLEAGNRSFDENVPEEINRRIIDHFADFNLAYTQHGKENLLREGLHPRNVIVIGSPLCEVLNRYSTKIENSPILSQLNLEAKKYFLVSVHRQENVDNPERLKQIIASLNRIALNFEMPVVVSTHPRTKEKLEALDISLNKLLIFHPPFGFFAYNKLQKESRVVLSDSGSVSEESVILNFPAITIRNSMERPEALESGSIILSGIEENGILRSICVLESSNKPSRPPEEYSIPDTSNRVIRFISSTLQQHNFWSGLRKSI
jgi:UDP-N-acetylglucosamine 2-epimerase (non-hydrolysing)